MPPAILVRRPGFHQRQKLVAHVDEGLAIAAPAQGEAENLAVEGERLVDVADFERDVIDADQAGQGGGHGGVPVRGDAKGLVDMWGGAAGLRRAG
jgi:hypothetical protein